MENQEDKNGDSSVNQPTPNIQNVSEAYINHNEKNSKSINSTILKKYFLYILIGGLVVSALITISAILVGEFSYFILKALGTTASIVIHSLLALVFIRINDKKNKLADEIFINIIFAITVLSFMTSLFKIWEIIEWVTAIEIYSLYFNTFVGALVCRALLGVHRVNLYTKHLSNSSIVLTITLFLLLIPNVFHVVEITSEIFYWRLIAATSVLLGTASVLTVISDRLFINKHPEMHQKQKGSKIFTVFIVILALIFIIYIWRQVTELMYPEDYYY